MLRRQQATGSNRQAMHPSPQQHQQKLENNSRAAAVLHGGPVLLEHRPRNQCRNPGLQNISLDGTIRTDASPKGNPECQRNTQAPSPQCGKFHHGDAGIGCLDRRKAIYRSLLRPPGQYTCGGVHGGRKTLNPPAPQARTQTASQRTRQEPVHRRRAP